MPDITVPDITVAEYLLRRLHAAGVRHVFGVPGDFTLGLNEAIHATGLLEWVGTANELGAGYAADGYARRRGLGALVTTYGVGELGCLSAIAGSYAEHVPVVQITAAPSAAAMAAGALVHHSLGDGDHERFVRMYREVTVAAETITAADPGGAIDRVLGAVHTHLRPGYLRIPMDLVGTPADATRLDIPVGPTPSKPQALQAFTAAARQLLDRTTKKGPPVVIVGRQVERMRAEPALKTLIEAGGLPAVTLLDAKGALDERHPQHHGLYLAAVGDKVPRAVVDEAPALITVGVLWSDSVSGFYTRRVDRDHTIALDTTSATVGGQTFGDVRLTDALTALTTLVTGSGDAAVHPVLADPTCFPGRDCGGAYGDAPLTHASLWAAIQAWLPQGHTLIAESGTTSWGALDVHLPPDTVFIGQSIWSAIGYALPATLGATLADPDRRAVLVTGDGAAMMTAQELGVLAPRAPGTIIVIVDNGGYTIERILRSPNAPYHDIPAWDWTGFASAVAGAVPPLTRRATTSAEFVHALAQAEHARDRLTVIHAVTGALDIPRLLEAVVGLVRQHEETETPSVGISA